MPDCTSIGQKCTAGQKVIYELLSILCVMHQCVLVLLKRYKIKLFLTFLSVFPMNRVPFFRFGS